MWEPEELRVTTWHLSDNWQELLKIANGDMPLVGPALIWLASHTYPDCSAPAVCGPSAARTQGYGYTRGRLISVTGFANSITYHPSGLINSIVRANGTTDRQTADPNGMARPAEISSVRTSDTLGCWRQQFRRDW